MALRRAPVDITLVDRRNHHLFLPLLYQVATAGLNPGDIARPIRRILRRQRNVTVLMAEARRVRLESRRVDLDGAEVGYDYLILAPGARPHYFGNDAWKEFAPGLGGLGDALRIRQSLVLAYEKAERERDEAERKRLLTFVVVGGGPTGVELAGAIAEMARRAMAREFRRIDPRSTRVLLLEGGERILPTFPEDLARRARRSLERLGVEVRTGDLVKDVDGKGVEVDGERLEASAILWSAGVAGARLDGIADCVMGPSGKILVESDLSIPGRPEVFVAGDLAAVREGDGFVPGLAPAAIQMGRRAAANVEARVEGRRTGRFVYRDRGSLATIGRSSAIADFGRVRLSGFVAWVAWLAIHIYFLIGFRNRLIVLFQWAWAYWTYERGARLVTDAVRGGRACRG